MTTKRNVAIGTGGAAVIAATVAFLPAWEGTDHVAKRDAIGTGHPLTWCHGQTSFDDPTVKPGQRFTDKECDDQLAAELPRYLNEIGPSVHRPVPVKVMASLLDAAWNAGSGRVRTSPMVAKINAGDIRGGCNAFDGWIVRSAGQVRKGLIDRRSGELHGDHRKSERALCLEGAKRPEVRAVLLLLAGCPDEFRAATSERSKAAHLGRIQS
jgi:lysozyme